MSLSHFLFALVGLFYEHPFQWAGIVAYFFLCWASFSGVMADRLPRQVGLRMEGHVPVVGEPDLKVNLFSLSRCDACGHRISPIALIPVLGWLINRGRCGHCHARVPVVYPVVEGLSAVVAATIALHFGPTGTCLSELMILAFCIPISWIDFRYHWIPDRLGMGMLFSGLMLSPFAEIHDRVYGAAFMMCALAACFWYQKLRRGLDTMAMGDVILFGAAGAWLGVERAPVVMFLTAAIYASYALPLKFMGRRTAGLSAEDVCDGQNWFALGPAIVFSVLVAGMLPNMFSF